MASFTALAAKWAKEGIDAPPLVGTSDTVESDHLSTLEIMTMQGTVVALRHSAPDVAHDAEQEFLPVFLGGALGGLSGTGALWQRLARRYGGVRLHYRFASDMESSLLDVLMIYHHLRDRIGLRRVALIGHSFGGGVAAGAAVLLGEGTAGVVCLAGQLEGTQLLKRIAGTPVLIIHGHQDGHIPWHSARRVHQDAAEPKELWVIPDGDHVMAGHVDVLDERIGRFIGEVRDADGPGPIA